MRAYPNECGAFAARKSLLPADYTPMQNLLAGWYYLAYEPYDEGSQSHKDAGEDICVAKDSEERKEAFEEALNACCEKLLTLDVVAEPSSEPRN